VTYKLNVIITCDVECWPERQEPHSQNVEQAVADHIYGVTRSGDQRGISWQMDVLDSYGLRGVFFVESLFGAQGYAGQLQRVVESIARRGHDAELHLHTEWYGYFPGRAATRERRQHLRSYPYHEQVEILQEARDALRAAGAGEVVAFRAGNFGANDDTLRAVAAVGLAFDSSYNAAYLGEACEITSARAEVEPFQVGSVWEYPVTCFRDRPWLSPEHVRPLQITAASRSEISAVLLQAHRRRLDTVVILTHSFEITHLSDSPAARPRAHRLNAGRFREVCRLLAEHADLFRVLTFRDLQRANLCPPGQDAADRIPTSSMWNYLVRGAQNAVADLVKW
jgi:hypothetical protein